MAKRKAARRTQKKGRGRGSHFDRPGAKVMTLKPGVVIELPNGMIIEHLAQGPK